MAASRESAQQSQITPDFSKSKLIIKEESYTVKLWKFCVQQKTNVNFIRLRASLDAAPGIRDANVRRSMEGSNSEKGICCFDCEANWITKRERSSAKNCSLRGFGFDKLVVRVSDTTGEAVFFLKARQS